MEGELKKVDLEKIYQHSKNNRAEILKSKTCGCFYCKKIFSPKEIKNWLKKENTALCPYCTIDTVVGDASGVEITSGLLEEMHKRYF